MDEGKIEWNEEELVQLTETERKYLLEQLDFHRSQECERMDFWQGQTLRYKHEYEEAQENAIAYGRLYHIVSGLIEKLENQDDKEEKEIEDELQRVLDTDISQAAQVAWQTYDFTSFGEPIHRANHDPDKKLTNVTEAEVKDIAAMNRGLREEVS